MLQCYHINFEMCMWIATFNYLLLGYGPTIRQWGQLVTWHHLYQEGCVWLVHFIPPIFHCSGENRFVPSVVQCCTVPLLLFCCCCFILDIHASGILMSLSIPVDVIRVTSCVDRFLDPTCVPVSISINTFCLATKHQAQLTSMIWMILHNQQPLWLMKTSGKQSKLSQSS